MRKRYKEKKEKKVSQQRKEKESFEGNLLIVDHKLKRRERKEQRDIQCDPRIQRFRRNDVGDQRQGDQEQDWNDHVQNIVLPKPVYSNVDCERKKERKKSLVTIMNKEGGIGTYYRNSLARLDPGSLAGRESQ